MPFAKITPDKRFFSLLKRLTPEQARIIAEQTTIDFALLLERKLKIRSPRRTGNLARRWFARPKGTTIFAGNTADYSAGVEWGTKPHHIRPKNKLVLAWRSGGRGAASSFAGGKTTSPNVFSKKVFHPGTKGQFIFKNTFQIVSRRALELFGVRAESAFARL